MTHSQDSRRSDGSNSEEVSVEPEIVGRADSQFDRLLGITNTPFVVALLLAIAAWAVTHIVDRVQETRIIEFSAHTLTETEELLCDSLLPEAPIVQALRFRNLSRKYAAESIVIELEVLDDSLDLPTKEPSIGNICVINTRSSLIVSDVRPQEISGTLNVYRKIEVKLMPPEGDVLVLVERSAPNGVLSPLVSIKCHAKQHLCGTPSFSLSRSSLWTWLVRNEFSIVLLIAALASILAIASTWRSVRPRIGVK